MARKVSSTNDLGPAARQHAVQRHAVGAFLVVVAVAIAFVAGFMVRGNTQLMTDLGFISTTNVQSTEDEKDTLSDPGTSVTARVGEVEGILLAKSLDEFEVDSTSDTLIAAFLKATEDPYSQYFTRERYATYVKELSSDLKAGIGVLFAEYEGQIYAAEVFENSAAQMAGVREGDFVKAIDGVDASEWTTTEVVKKLTRNTGDTVIVTWRRPTSLEATGGEEFATSLVCSEYRQANVETELVDSIGYMSISQLTQNASDLMQTAVAQLDSQGANAFVLDLRDCPGGFLTEAVDMASLFVKSGTIVQIKTKDAITTKTANGAIATEKPLVVLVNGNTAAAAEVLAASLQDSGRATIVGKKTMGKGSVQVVTELSFGGAIRYTAAHYLTPSGNEINVMGISPDVSIEDADTQKDTAIAIAQSLS